jgi:hypothetical protein
MLKFFKPPRGNGTHQRGYFSYITEAVVHIHNVLLNHPNEKLKIYYDLSNIQGYGNQNIYEACFIQDENDYLTNINEYSNIELVNYISKLNAYESETLTEENLKMCESIIKDNFILNDEMKQLLSSRHSQIDFTKTIGFHRRATDMATVHHLSTIDLSDIFNILEQEEFENVFLMSDNLKDLNEFKKRYGNKLITFDEFTSSKFDNNPFFKVENDEESIKQHIREIVFGAYTLGMTKKLICTKSNLSTFSIFSNSKLNYKRLN